eukprot:GEZU01002509.1.p2 GENE.GEZU01002509.1~~GEZU01002509.1.p2  ORF type:complete len:136 (+),score=53.03 GEZU01002509.1:775-1182(+)
MSLVEQIGLADTTWTFIDTPDNIILEANFPEKVFKERIRMNWEDCPDDKNSKYLIIKGLYQDYDRTKPEEPYVAWLSKHKVPNYLTFDNWKLEHHPGDITKIILFKDKNLMQQQSKGQELPSQPVQLQQEATRTA